MSKELEALRRKLARAQENLNLILERKDEYVQAQNIPLELIKDERRLQAQIASLQAQIIRLEQENEPLGEKRPLASWEFPTFAVIIVLVLVVVGMLAVYSLAFLQGGPIVVAPTNTPTSTLAPPTATLTITPTATPKSPIPTSTIAPETPTATPVLPVPTLPLPTEPVWQSPVPRPTTAVPPRPTTAVPPRPTTAVPPRPTTAVPPTWTPTPKPTTPTNTPVTTTTVPNVMGMDSGEAADKITSVGLVPIRLKVQQAGCAPYTVIGLSPDAGTALPLGSEVALDVCELILATVPNVIGMQREAAFSTLQVAGFNPVYAERTCDGNQPNHQVWATDPGPGSAVPNGSTVTIFYYEGCGSNDEI